MGVVLLSMEKNGIIAPFPPGVELSDYTNLESNGSKTHESESRSNNTPLL
jgi:hypothetical protein